MFPAFESCEMIIRVAGTEGGKEKVDNKEEEKWETNMCLNELLIRPLNHMFTHLVLTSMINRTLGT